MSPIPVETPLEKENPLLGMTACGLFSAVILFISFWILVDLDSRLPREPRFEIRARELPDFQSMRLYAPLFENAQIPGGLYTNETGNPFFTRHFEPPPPVVKTHETHTLIYRGFFEVRPGQGRAYVTVNKTENRLALGEELVGGFQLAEMALRTLTVTNAAGEVHVLEFLAPYTITIPLK